MRSVAVTQYGEPEVIAIRELPTPVPGAGEVLIEVRASGVDPVDVAIRAGFLAPMIGDNLPVGAGWAAAGVVDAVGAGVTGFEPGQRVIALEDTFLPVSGAQASHVLVPATAVAHTPDELTDAQAVTLPLNALTADQALDLLALEPGSSLLVTGAAGNVGGFAVALGAARALKVTGLASAAAEEWVRAQGAVGFLARGEALPVGAFDGVLDAANLVADAVAALRDGGVFLAVTDNTKPEPQRGIRIEKVSVHGDGPRLAELAAAAVSGTLPTRVAATVAFDEVAEAHRVLGKGSVRGQVVLLA